jgi:hypothetical protein
MGANERKKQRKGWIWYKLAAGKIGGGEGMFVINGRRVFDRFFNTKGRTGIDSKRGYRFEEK